MVDFFYEWYELDAFKLMIAEMDALRVTHRKYYGGKKTQLEKKTRFIFSQKLKNGFLFPKENSIFLHLYISLTIF